MGAFADQRMAAIGRAALRVIATPETEDLAEQYATPDEVVEHLRQLQAAARVLDGMAEAGRRHVLPLSDDELALLYQVVTVASVEDAQRGVETPGLPVLLMRVRALAAEVPRG